MKMGPFALLLFAQFCGQSLLADAVDTPRSRCEALQQVDLFSVPDAPTQVLSARHFAADEEGPAYCEVRGYVAPSVGIRIALPEPWNGKLLKVGCGGHCGVLDEQYLAFTCEDAMRRGYACVASDMGHTGLGVDALWAHQNLQAKIDWGFRATHVAALAGKAVTEKFYGKPSNRAYFIGCSTGGRQALQEAQRFPWDFDGIIAGAPPVDLATLYMSFAWAIRMTRDSEGRSLLGKVELQLLTEASREKCDLDDGLRDGIIGNPLQCSFQPAELTCKAGQRSGCLTRAQVDAVNKVYRGPMTSVGTQLSMGGPVIGSELQWEGFLGTSNAPPSYQKFVTDALRILFFQPEQGPGWKLSDFDFDRDYKRMGVMQAIYDSGNPDLRRFKEAGGKLIMFQGLNDPSVLPRSTIDYYEKVERVMGGAELTRSFARLFVLPGVNHCMGGEGADTVDYLGALEDWVERGHAPDRLIAAHVKTDEKKPPFWLAADPAQTAFTRPIYPYPLKARYKGIGDPNDASSFEATRD